MLSRSRVLLRPRVGFRVKIVFYSELQAHSEDFNETVIFPNTVKANDLSNECIKQRIC